jgi:hypothetical protein
MINKMNYIKTLFRIDIKLYKPNPYHLYKW